MDGAESNQPLVLDNGTGVMKAGFAGDERPKCVFPSFVGRPKHTRLMAGGELAGDYFFGDKAEEHRGALKLSYPMEHGAVTDWDDMERVWRHTYSSAALGVSSEEHPVLLTEAPLNPRKNREKAAEIFFETLNVPALFLSPQATLSLYASGRTTGTVLDSGDGVTHCVPVYEGFAIPNAITRVDVAGRDVTDHLMLLLRKAGYTFHTSAEREVVRQIKEECCYVAYNPSKEEDEFGSSPALVDYNLPDGQTITVGPEQFRAPEILFQPSQIGLEYRGVHQCLADSIMKTDLDLRRTLFQQIVLAGGSTMFSGFPERMVLELKKLAPHKETKIRVSAPPERKHLTWIGGSILASLGTFKEMWIRRDEWDDVGPNIVHRKTL